MTMRTGLLITLAVISAIITFVLAKSWIDSQRDQLRRQAEAMKPKPTESVNVLVARSNLPSGLILKKDHVEWKPWPHNGVSPNFYQEGRDQVDVVEGAVVRGGIIAGEPVLRGRVLHPGDQGFLAAVLKPGMSAVSVRVRPETSVSGFVKPGDLVDIILTHSVVPPTSDPPMAHRIAETILTDVRVIATDQTPNDQSGNASIAKTITLEVTPKQAEVVTVASNFGDLSFSLRSLANEELEADQVAAKPRSRSRTWDSEASAVIPPVSPRNQLQVVRGNQQQTVGTGPATSPAAPAPAQNAQPTLVQGTATALSPGARGVEAVLD